MAGARCGARDPGSARSIRLARPGRTIRCALLTLAATLLAEAAAADSLRCNGELIRVGDPTARLATECGQPISREVVAVVRAYEDGGQRRAVYAEEWAYETAGVDGYRLLRFEGGRLVGEGMRCSGRLVGAGDTTFTVMERCGEPVRRDSAGLVHELPDPASRALSTESAIEQWVYDLGAGKLLQIITVRGGVIERIEDGPRR